MTPIPLLIGVSACLGAVFATACMLMGWIMDAKDEKKRIAKVKEKAYQDGFCEGFDAGREWRFRTMVVAKRELKELREMLERLEDSTDGDEV